MLSNKIINKRKIELLAPGGDTDSVKTAILAGADAVYCGLHIFNARNRAANIKFDDLKGLLRIAHRNNCKIFLTLNIVFFHSEFSAIFKLLNQLVNTSIDGVIVQDIGLFYIISKYFPSLKVHASTQVTTHNVGQVKFLKRLNVERVNLSRELNISEIRDLTVVAHENNMSVEVFVHGSYCISFSGLCFMSSVHGGKSGNRGRCSQPCRENYSKTEQGKEFPLNMKDNCAYSNVKGLYEAGVDSFKIEGRIKEFDYVHTVVTAWRKQLDNFASKNSVKQDNSELHKVFNRDFTNAFLVDNLTDDMFIDNPMSNSGKYLEEAHGLTLEYELLEEQKKLYGEKEKQKGNIKAEIDKINITKIPLRIVVSGSSGFPLKMVVETPDSSFELYSKSNLAKSGNKAIDLAVIESKFNGLNDTDFLIDNINLDLEGKLYLPFREITAIKNEILYVLNGSKNPIAPVPIPVLKGNKSKDTKTTLSVLISDYKDLYLCEMDTIDVYFQLPNSFCGKVDEFVRLFQKHGNLIPWFPSVLIGDDYVDAVEFLHLLQPELIVTNNTGIANDAFVHGIAWIAGPFLNITNSYSLLALKEKYNCCGSFISNEVPKQQINLIRKPEEFKIFFSIYHPIALMISRACFFRTVTGCQKQKMDSTCLSHCTKQAEITNENEEIFYIEKSKGCYNRIYSPFHMLNTDIVRDINNKFDSFFIDLREIKTGTLVNNEKTELIALFKDIINGDNEAVDKLKQNVYPMSNSQYTAKVI